MVVYKPKKKLFNLIPIEGSNNSFYQYSGILYPDGHVDVGIDAFRLLGKTDIPEYPIQSYRNMAEVRKHFIPVNIKKGYYMDNVETGREITYGYRI